MLPKKFKRGSHKAYRSDMKLWTPPVLGLAVARCAAGASRWMRRVMRSGVSSVPASHAISSGAFESHFTTHIKHTAASRDGSMALKARKRSLQAGKSADTPQCGSNSFKQHACEALDRSKQALTATIAASHVEWRGSRGWLVELVLPAEHSTP